VSTSVLLSIKPEFAEKIFNGVKRYEFRRVIFRSRNVSRVVVYASSPVQRVVGEFRIGAVLELGKQHLWRKTKRHAGINKPYFDAYFSGRPKAFAIKIEQPRRYETPLQLRNLSEALRPPQSFVYLND
jgi:predicted transcriptional regulator